MLVIISSRINFVFILFFWQLAQMNLSPPIWFLNCGVAVLLATPNFSQMNS